jgi:Rrf2 family nitric oxide-sensitive transcriptional repressor
MVMRLTRFTDNALRCLMYLGQSDRETETIAEVARRMAMSEDHLLKVVRRLQELGLVQSVRGRYGGIHLTVAPEEIRVGQVVRATEENLCLVPCFGDDPEACPLSMACRLAPVLDEALAAFMAALDRYTLADLVRNRVALRRALAAADS